VKGSLNHSVKLSGHLSNFVKIKGFESSIRRDLKIKAKWFNESIGHYLGGTLQAF